MSGGEPSIEAENADLPLSYRVCKPGRAADPSDC
jgi:hypothetical protein